MSRRNIEAVYPLSPMQEGMLYHSLQAPDSGVYVEQTTAALRGALDVAAFKQAWDEVLRRHPILRTAFAWQSQEQPLQVVQREVTLIWDEREWRALGPGEQENCLQAYLADDRRRGFDPARAPLMRMALFRLTDEVWQFVWSHHHLLLDGWSLPQVMSEVFKLYEAYRQGEALQLPAVRPFRDYIGWLQQRDPARAEGFWRQMLAGFDTPVALTLEKSLQAAQPGAGSATVERRLAQETSARLAELARERQLTVSTIVQAAWAILLARYSGADDVVYGMTVAGRPPELPGIETMIGLFINTLPVRLRLTAEQSVLACLRELQDLLLQLRQYEDTPLVTIQAWSELPANTPLFESIVVFENYPLTDVLERQQCNFVVEGVRSFEQVNYPLTLVSGPGERLPLKLVYDPQRYSRATIERMLGHLANLLAEISADPGRSIGALQLLRNAERKTLLQQWIGVARPWPEQCLHELIAEQAHQNPAAVAVRCGGAELSYAELNERANRLARYLRHLDVGPGVIVGVSMDRVPELIVAFLGILKAGGAYLPIDPSYPAERQQFMIEDSGIELLLSSSTAIDRLPAALPRTLLLDRDWPAIGAESSTDLETLTTSDDLAYVIYTSGSTGRPKGVLLHHRGAVNFGLGAVEAFAIEPGDRVLQFAALSFDAALAEFMMALLAGATLVLAPQTTLSDGSALLKLMAEEAIAAAILPPSLLAVLPAAELPALKTLASAGEACARETWERWAPGRRFINGYGPTEASIGPSLHHFAELPADLGALPIGNPLPNTSILIRDHHGELAPPGVVGEICIGGVGVSHGYLNRPDLTAERFIADRFSSQAGARLYRTGDLGRYRADGLIEFLGRIDHQVKIRGFRIELGEIEATLRQQAAVREAVVVAREDQPGDRRLVAYLLPAEGQAIDVALLRSALETKLPGSMVPAHFVVLERYPLTPNGKIDRKALPAPELAQLSGEVQHLPRNPSEEILAGIWKHLLKLEQVGIADNFFHLGGHSLLATRLAARIREAFALELSLQALFERPTIAAMAEQIAAARESARPLPPPVRPAEPGAAVPASFAQQRLWFLDQLEPDSPLYNNPATVRVSGRLDHAALSRSMNMVVHRHASLRTRFAVLDGEPVQIIAATMAIELPLIDLSALPAAGREQQARARLVAEANRPFDLASGPLLRVVLLRLSDDEHLLFINLHHIISDGWSTGVLVRELATCYAALLADQAPDLPELTVQYADYAIWQRDWLRGEALEAELDYWRRQLAGTPALLELATDRPRPALVSYRGGHVSFALPAELVARLSNMSGQEGATLYMLLLAAYMILLQRYSRQDDICVGTPIANRRQMELEPLIGFFVNTLVLRGDLSGNPSFRQLLRRIRAMTLDAYAHQDLPFEMLVEALQPERSLSHTPLFQVMFVFNNTPVPALELAGLSFQPLEVETGQSRFDLTLEMSQIDAGLYGSFEYNRDLFDAATIERMVTHFTTLLTAIADGADQPLAELNMLPSQERLRLLVDWNASESAFASEHCVHWLFERQVIAQPAAPALRFAGRSLSYAEVDAQANRLAHELLARGLAPGSLVGIAVDRSPEQIISVLAVLKAGGAFVPLDPHYPVERLAFMLADAHIAFLLTTSNLDYQHWLEGARELNGQSEHPVQLLLLDQIPAQLAAQPATPPQQRGSADDLAYVIYTSGSTGRPKGTLLQHRGLCNLAEVQRQAFDLAAGKRVLQFSPFSFDASVWELVMALCNGATLVLAPQQTLASGPDLLRLLHDEAITTVTLPPSLLAVLDPGELPQLETVIAAGEACTAELVQRWAPGRRFFNAYGPTETTVCASMYRCDPAEAGNPPIGRPIANFQLYILDTQGQPAPVGVPGELHIGGVGVARGYLNRPELTAERFINNPFSLRYGARLYRSGDLARYRADGNIEFLGRIDQQVKLRGFRIELDEIAANLRRHQAVQDALAVVREDSPGTQQLLAYVILAAGQSAGNPAELSAELRAHLRQLLPEYMLPAAVLALEAWPLTPSGKIDRKALPAAGGLQRAAYVAPRNQTETTLVAICEELLALEQVGVYDNFFELGGHSLLATRLLARVHAQIGVEVPVRSLFEDPTIGGLAARIDAARAEQPAERDIILEALAELDQLSEDEIKARLETLE